MGQMTKEEIEAAMDQIANCVVSVKLPRLTADDIEELTRPKKRRAKQRYSTLDFSDDRSYFQKTCTDDKVWQTGSKRKRGGGRKRKKAEKDEPPKKEWPSYLSVADVDEKPFKKCKFFKEMAALRVKEEVDPPSSTFSLPVKAEPKEDPPKSTIVWKIRIRSAYELGSNIIFVDESVTPSKPDAYQPVLSDLITCEAEPKVTDRSNFAAKFDIRRISSLYKEFFTNENRMIIKKVAEVLLNLTESIKKKNDKLTEINCSKNTDAEKLMLRHQAHGEFNRVRDANQIILKKQFEAIGHSLKQENFEILFQLFFLGVMKTLIVSVSNKKGTLFKKIVSLLSQSLSSCEYQNERILNLLKSKDFRADCMTLVHYLEKCSETKSFDMLFISDADKSKLLSAKNLADHVDMSESLSSKPSLLSVNAKIPSIMKYAKGMNILPVGCNLLLQTVNSSSVIQSRVDPVADINKKKSKITAVLINSMNSTKLTPLNRIVPSLGTKKPFPQSNFNVVTSLPSSAPIYKVSRLNSVTSSSMCSPSYSGNSAGTVPLTVVRALPNNTQANSSSQSVGNLVNSNSNTQAGGSYANLNSCVQPMCTYPARSPSIQTSSTFTNCSSAGQSRSLYMNPSSNVQPVSGALTNSSSNTNTNCSNFNQSAPQLTPPVSSATISTSSYQFVRQTSLPSVVPTNCKPNVVFSSSRTSDSLHSVAVASGNPAVSRSHTIGPPPPYGVISVGASARRIVQPSPPLPQLLPPVVPPLQPDAVSARRMMQSPSPMPQLLPPVISNLHSQSADDIGRGIIQPSSPLAQLQPPAVPKMFQSPAESAAIAVRSIMQSSPPLPELLPPVVPNLQAQPVSQAFIANDISVQNCNERRLSATDAQNRGEFALRTYSSAKEMSKRVQIPSAFDQNGMTSAFHDNPALRSSLTTAGSGHQFVVPASYGNGVVSASVTGSQASNQFSPYRTISPAGNCENIQPHSPHSLLHQNSGDGSSTNDRVTLRTLLMDSGRAPLVNQNGPIDAPCQYPEKMNFSLDLPPVVSSDALNDDTLALSHFSMTNYVGSPFS